jgi:hypothetical protein
MKERDGCTRFQERRERERDRCKKEREDAYRCERGERRGRERDGWEDEERFKRGQIK